MGRKSFIIVLSALLLSCFQASGTDRKTYMIRSEELRMDVEYLSSDDTGGRAAGTPGHQKAAHYIHRRFRQVGLMPVSGFNSMNFTFVESRRQDTLSSHSIIGHNIIGMIESGDPETTRYIVVGTHYDGLGAIGGKMYPGADSETSGVAVLIQLAKTLRALRDDGVKFHYSLIFVAFDAMRSSDAGSVALLESSARGLLTDGVTGKPIRPEQIALMVSPEQIGSCLAPCDPLRPDYLMAIGEKSLPFRWQGALDVANLFYGYRIDLHRDYYGSERFTEAFYRMGERKAFVKAGIPVMYFTSGITDLTNSVRDTAANIDFPLLRRRTIIIYNFLSTIVRFE